MCMCVPENENIVQAFLSSLKIFALNILKQSLLIVKIYQAKKKVSNTIVTLSAFTINAFGILNFVVTIKRQTYSTVANEGNNDPFNLADH